MPLSRRILPLAGLAVLVLTAPPARADAATERAQIHAARQAVERRHAAAQRECRERFAVTACLDEAGARRRAELAPLREQELRIDEAERQARAAQRRAAIAAKQAAAASRPALPASAAPTSAARASGGAASAPQRPQVRLRDHGAAQAAEAAERARAAEQRRREARLTQERIARRLAELAAKGQKPQTLPPPDTPASAGR
jgi:hypothetical protein